MKITQFIQIVLLVLMLLGGTELRAQSTGCRENKVLGQTQCFDQKGRHLGTGRKNVLGLTDIYNDQGAKTGTGRPDSLTGGIKFYEDKPLRLKPGPGPNQPCPAGNFNCRSKYGK
ncbi:MAG: hypothetical protein LBK52_00895 [Deltaproteobacteria bacterium]|jgi:hypothetical protein|nr:hypothetical protein [Deltaproteobacteria bacterium]